MRETVALSQDVNSHSPSQIERFRKPLVALKDILQASDRLKVVDELAKRGRGPLFAIEGLARLYEERYGKPISRLKEESKWLEDRVGRLIDYQDHVDFAKAIAVPPETLRYLEKEREAYRQKLSRSIEKKNWLGADETLLSGWETILRETVWDEPEKDRQYLLEKLLEITHELQKEKWDIHDLQEGLHEFRRRLRWFLIYTQVLGNLIDFDGRPLPAFASILSDPVAHGPYSQLSPGKRVSFPILIPKEVFLELTKAVDQLGRAKDIGEAEFEWLPEALLGSKGADTKKEAKERATELVRKHSTYVPVFQTGQAILDRLRAKDDHAKDKEAKGILTALKYRLKQQVDWTEADCARALKGAN